jgi:hypothetical protein
MSLRGGGGESGQTVATALEEEEEFAHDPAKMNVLVAFTGSVATIKV